MRTAGIIVTSIAAAHAVAGIVVVGLGLGLGSQPHGEQDSNVAPFLLTGIGPLLGLTSAVAAGVGVSLWVMGARAPREGAAGLLPGFAIGPSGGALRWAF